MRLVTFACPTALATLALAAAGCVSSASATTSAASRTVLVELFTSQGCSSCPPADAFVRELPALGLGRTRVVPLTFHVDYWNGLGWKDPFSSTEFTERQHHYVEVGGLRTPEGRGGLDGLYTPQMIVDGTVHFSGGRRDVALAEIRRAADAPPVLDLAGDAVLDGNHAQVTLRVTPRAPAGTERWSAFVAVAARSARTNVTRGENGGETLEEAAVVHALTAPVPVSLEPGAPPLHLTVTRPRELAWSAIELTAVVQSPKTLHVAAARSLGLPPKGETR
jgi:hypothetical protein